MTDLTQYRQAVSAKRIRFSPRGLGVPRRIAGLG